MPHIDWLYYSPILYGPLVRGPWSGVDMSAANLGSLHASIIEADSGNPVARLDRLRAAPAPTR